MRYFSKCLAQIFLRYLAWTLVFVPALSQAQDAAQGHEIATRWCSSCHIVDSTATRAAANGLPTFSGLASNGGLSADRLRAAMTPQHSRMPDFALSKRQQDDLVTYIFSLRK
jgi:mono/diheme cytochrome c family protein